MKTVCWNFETTNFNNTTKLLIVYNYQLYISLLFDMRNLINIFSCTISLYNSMNQICSHSICEDTLLECALSLEFIIFLYNVLTCWIEFFLCCLCCSVHFSVLKKDWCMFYGELAFQIRKWHQSFPFWFWQRFTNKYYWNSRKLRQLLCWNLFDFGKQFMTIECKRTKRNYNNAYHSPFFTVYILVCRWNKVERE